ncbi:MAG: hypothetical protein ACK5NG_00700 [Chthoniobacterales bacterium]
MNGILITYTLYLTIAIPVTIWVARTLYSSGRVFLLNCFGGDEEMADSVNRLLLVGFYLVNVGFVVIYLKFGGEIQGAKEVLDALSRKLGLVLLILGSMHFFNLLVLMKLSKGKRAILPPAL